MQENINIYSKKGKKKQKTQNIEKSVFSIETPKIILQDVDLETETKRQSTFEGTDL
jgi:ribosomal protein L4